MDPRSDIDNNFKEFGVELSSEVLSKCEEICLQHHITGLEFVESWMAYALSNLGGGGNPSLENLPQFERKQFAKTVSKDALNKNSARRQPRGSPLVVYGSNTANDSISEDIISTYCTTPKRKTREKRPVENVTPEDQYSGKRQISSGRSPRVAFSPASYSPSAATPSSAYVSRSNVGETVCEFGRRSAGLAWKPRGPMPSLQVALYGNGPHLSADARFMYEKLSHKSGTLSDRIISMGSHLLQLNGLPDDSNFGVLHVETAVGVGRVCCDANGRLNPSSVILEGSYSSTCGKSVPMILSHVASYALFPGQIVAVEGTNPSGSNLIAHKIYGNAAPDFPDEPIRLKASEGPLHVVAAAGPYNPMDTMIYQPLEDLMEYVQKNEPHVLILIGPLLDSNHTQVKENTLANTFDTEVEKIVDIVSTCLKGLHTKVVIVSSSRDVVGLPIYPTPPYKLRRPHPDIVFAPDPCILDLGGVIIGVTATDVIKHISKEEICNPPQGGDRLGRLASHLLSQRSFYPLYPPSEDVFVDSEMSENFCEIPVKPHVLILPSDLRFFLKDVNGCVVANPERLTKGKAGGTFVRFEIKPVPENKSLLKSTVAEVVRI